MLLDWLHPPGVGEPALYSGVVSFNPRINSSFCISPTMAQRQGREDGGGLERRLACCSRGARRSSGDSSGAVLPDIVMQSAISDILAIL
jgi:hypothetical protein